MHVGLAVSVLLHVAILGWAIFTIQTQRQLLLPETEPIAVELITPSEVTKVRQGVRTAKQIEAEAKETPKPEISKKEAPKPTPPVALPKAEPPPPPKEEAKAEPPKPEPPKVEPPKVEEPKPEPPKEVAKPEPPKPPEPVKDQIAEQLATEKPDPAIEQAKLDEQKREEERKLAEERKKAEEHKKAEEARKQAELKKKLDDDKKRKEAELKKKEEEKKRKEAEAKKKFDAENIAALLNKVPDKGAPTYAKPPEEPTKNKGPILGSKEGRDLTLSVSERQRLVALLTEKIRTCYRPPVGATAGLEGLKVSLSFDLKRDGSLIPGSIRVRGVGGAPALPVAVEAAERAIIGCQPYDMLPPDKYDFWKGVDLIFNPKDLFGG